MKPCHIVLLLLTTAGLALFIPGAVQLSQDANCDYDCPDNYGEVPLFVIGAFLLVGALVWGCYGSRGSGTSTTRPPIDPEAVHRVQDAINMGNTIAQQQATYDAWQANNYQQTLDSINQNNNYLNIN
jgi:hypothetical protein